MSNFYIDVRISKQVRKRKFTFFCIIRLNVLINMEITSESRENLIFENKLRSWHWVHESSSVSTEIQRDECVLVSLCPYLGISARLRRYVKSFIKTVNGSQINSSKEFKKLKIITWIGFILERFGIVCHFPVLKTFKGMHDRMQLHVIEMCKTCEMY